MSQGIFHQRMLNHCFINSFANGLSSRLASRLASGLTRGLCILALAHAQPALAIDGDHRLPDAAMKHDIATVTALLAEGVDPNARGQFDTPSLLWLARVDEVEAALDDVNLGRLLVILEELRASSQLIIITHQKRTMEIADALYGVTMRGDGVTEVISQRLRESDAS